MDLYKDPAQGAENTLFEAPNDQIFPDTQVLKMDFCTPLWKPVSVNLEQKLFMSSDISGNFGRVESLRWLFVSSESFSCPDGSCRTFEGT